MDDIYVIYVRNNLDSELGSYEENEIGYAETEREAKNACEKFEEKRLINLIDSKRYRFLKNKCETCDEKCDSFTLCEVRKQLRELEKEDIYSGCHDIGEGSYFYRKIKKL